MLRRGASFFGLSQKCDDIQTSGDNVVLGSQNDNTHPDNKQWGKDVTDPNVIIEKQIAELQRISVSFEKATNSSHASMNKDVSSESHLVLFKTPLPYISNLDNPRSGFINTPEMHRSRSLQKLSPESLSSSVSLT